MTCIITEFISLNSLHSKAQVKLSHHRSGQSSRCQSPAALHSCDVNFVPAIRKSHLRNSGRRCVFKTHLRFQNASATSTSHSSNQTAWQQFEGFICHNITNFVYLVYLFIFFPFPPIYIYILHIYTHLYMCETCIYKYVLNSAIHNRIRPYIIIASLLIMAAFSRNSLIAYVCA